HTEHVGGVGVGVVAEDVDVDGRAVLVGVSGVIGGHRGSIANDHRVGCEFTSCVGTVVRRDQDTDCVTAVPVAGRGQVQGRAGGPGDVGKARAGVLLPLVGVGDGVTVVVVARDRDREGVVGLGGSLVDRGRVHDRSGVGDRD